LGSFGKAGVMMFQGSWSDATVGYISRELNVHGEDHAWTIDYLSIANSKKDHV
jgi:Uri superfamily endonuclease